MTIMNRKAFDLMKILYTKDWISEQQNHKMCVSSQYRISNYYEGVYYLQLKIERLFLAFIFKTKRSISPISLFI